MKPKTKVTIIIIASALVIYLVYKATIVPDVKNPERATSTSTSSAPPPPVRHGYKIISEDTTESQAVADLRVKAVVNDDGEDIEFKKQYLYEIYEQVKDFNKEKENFMSPLVIGIYLYSSERRAKSNKEGFEVMLFKKASDSIPELKVGLYDAENKDSGMRAEYQALVQSFQAKGLDFCQIYFKYHNLINQSNKMREQSADEYLNKATHKLFSQYGLPDSTAREVQIYGDAFCQ